MSAPMSLTQPTRQEYYDQVSHILSSLLTEANPGEKQALYQTLEWLGIAEIRGEVSADELETPSAAPSKTTK